MKVKHNLILLIILIIFATLVLIIERPFENKAMKMREEALPLFPELQLEKVKKLLVRKSDNTTITLKNQDNVWYVVDKEDYPADPQAIDEAITKLRDLKKFNLVSSKKDKHALFEVKEGVGMEVIAFGAEDKKVADLLIGKAGPDLFSTYIRKADSDEVFLYGEYLKGQFDREVNTWRDKTIFAFNPDDATQLTMVHKDEATVLSKDTKGNWQMEKPISSLAEKTKVEEVLSMLSTLRASDIAAEEAFKDSGLDQPEYQISVKLKDDQKKTLYIGNKKEDRFYYAKSDEKNYLYFLYKSIVEKLTPSVKDLEKAKTEPEEEKQLNPPAEEKNLQPPIVGKTPF
ncbi:MAG: DUF4340 domain-containing protein [Pseudomonadota bacterium]